MEMPLSKCYAHSPSHIDFHSIPIPSSISWPSLLLLLHALLVLLTAAMTEVQNMLLSANSGTALHSIHLLLLLQLMAAWCRRTTIITTITYGGMVSQNYYHHHHYLRRHGVAELLSPPPLLTAARCRTASIWLSPACWISLLRSDDSKSSRMKPSSTPISLSCVHTETDRQTHTGNRHTE